MDFSSDSLNGLLTFSQVGWLVVAVACGGLVYRAGFRRGWQEGSREGRRARREEESALYLRGLNFLLADEPDKAIEEFIKVVRINSETVEIYLSLGSLFRARGEVGRAIRIHQNIIARPNLPVDIRSGAMFGLAEDFRQGGFVDRAVEAYRQVLEVAPNHQKALAGLQALHESEGRWAAALEILHKLHKVTGQSDPRREAHIRLKMGQEALRESEADRAISQFQAALKVFPGCVEACRLLGEWQLEVGNVRQAIKSFSTLKKTRPSHFFLLVDPLKRAYDLLGDAEGFEKCMSEAVDAPSASARLIIRWSQMLSEAGRLEEAAEVLRKGQIKYPGMAEVARRLIALEAKQGNWRDVFYVAEGCLDHLTSQHKNFQCSQCGFKSKDIYWKCPQCHRWDTSEPL
ncbi:MAG: tetratricopeptide repeat protein [Magnetococcales bacterium]|nr:tetratricopeptide repeat protein [Magnetococcales bacterium]